MNLEDLFQVISSAVADVAETSSGETPEAQRERVALVASHYLLEVVKRWNTPRMKPKRCAELALANALKNIQVEDSKELARVLREKRVFQEVPNDRMVEETDSMATVKEGTYQDTPGEDSTNRAAGGKAQESPPTDRGALENPIDDPVLLPEGSESRARTEKASHQEEGTSYPYSKPGRVTNLPRKVSPVHSVIPEPTRQGHEVLLPVSPETHEGGQEEMDVKDALKGLSDEEIKERINRLAKSQSEATQHLEEVDNPNKAASQVGTAGQNDNVQRVPCWNCKFETVSYEVKCVACGTKLNG